MTSSAAFVILGAGGHAAVVADLLAAIGHPVRGFVAPAGSLEALDHLGDDSALEILSACDIRLANGLGSTGTADRRIALFDRWSRHGFTFPSLIHPSATVARSAEAGAGTQIMAGAVVQARCQIGANVIVNTSASVDHDCRIGAHVHIAPGAVLSGGIEVGEGAHIGVGAVVIQNIHIGAGARVAAGAVVVRDVAAGDLVVGMPARSSRHG